MPGSHQCNVWLNGAGFEQTAPQHQLLLKLALSKKKPKKKHHQEAILLSYILIVKFPIIWNVKQEETKEEIPKQMRFRVPDIFRLIVRAMNPYSHSFTPRHPHGRTKPLQKFGFFQECWVWLQLFSTNHTQNTLITKHYLRRNSFDMTGANPTLTILSPQTNKNY